MKQKELCERVKCAVDTLTRELAIIAPEKNNPSVSSMYWRMEGQKEALEAVFAALSKDIVLLNILAKRGQS